MVMLAEDKALDNLGVTTDGDPAPRGPVARGPTCNGRPFQPATDTRCTGYYALHEYVFRSLENLCALEQLQGRVQ